MKCRCGPKTFGVLKHLVEHGGQLVSKEELLAAVWPNLIVTDDTLVQSVGELRRVFAESGRDYITTVPRRGYRFEAPRAAPVSAPIKRALRWRWKYGIAAPLVIAITIAALWFGLRSREAAAPAATDAGADGATHDRRTAFSEPERCLAARISGRRTHAGHHQFVGTIFRPHGDVVEFRGGLQGRAGQAG